MESGAARAAVEAACAALDRLDPARASAPAELREAWGAAESAVRKLAGGATGVGLELLRNALHQQRLTFDQANALAAFHDLAERAQTGPYQPGAADAGVIAAAAQALRGAGAAVPDLAGSGRPDAGGRSTPGRLPRDITPPGMRSSPLGLPEFVPPPRTGSHWAAWLVIILVVICGAGGAWYWFGGPRRDAVVRQAISAFDAGDTAAAASDFRRALLIDPAYAIPRVYLARIARNGGNLPAANAQLQLALTADPTNALALREMGAYLFTAGDYELARKFYVRAVTADPEDDAAMGYLGCTLVKLGRVDEAERWITRAGPGTWTSCVAAGSADSVPVR